MDENLKKAKSYSNIKHLLFIAETFLCLAYFIFIQISGLSAHLSYRAYIILNCRYLSLLAYMAVIGFFLNILTFPLDFTLSYKIEHRFGLSRQDFSSWFKDYLKKTIITFVFYGIGIMVLYYFMEISPRYWWLYTAFAYFFINVVIAQIFPVLIIPLFYRLEEITDISLKERILNLAQGAGIKVLNIYNIALGEKTKKANACVCGLGSTKRILLSDTLLKGYSQDEIEVTLAHELAHYKFKHFWKLSFWNFLFTFFGFAVINIIIQNISQQGRISSALDLTIFPILAVFFILYNIATLPIFNLISREYERGADIEAVRLTKKPASFSSLIEKLTLQNLSDPSPNFLIKIFFYNHPPAEERSRLYSRH